MLGRNIIAEVITDDSGRSVRGNAWLRMSPPPAVTDPAPIDIAFCA